MGSLLGDAAHDVAGVVRGRQQREGNLRLFGDLVAPLAGADVGQRGEAHPGAVHGELSGELLDNVAAGHQHFIRPSHQLGAVVDEPAQGG